MAIVCLGTECQKEGPDGDTEVEITIVMTITPSTGPINSLITFSAEGSKYEYNGDFSANLNYKWDFNYLGYGDILWDTELSAEPIHTYTYDSPGTYQVTLFASGGGASATETRSIVITEVTNTPPVAIITITPEDGWPWTYRSINGALSWDNEDEGYLQEFMWDKDSDGIYDGPFSEEYVFTQFYEQAGTFPVKLKVRDSEGLIGETVKNVIVFGPGGEPCQGNETVSYAGKVYNTVQIGEQCWFKENLDIGQMINSTTTQMDNEIIEKYCFDNNIEDCNEHGGFYQWEELMNHAGSASLQGICPTGWHVPTDDDWKILEGNTDSQYEVGDPHWDIISVYRGTDIGYNLMSQTLPNGYDKFGFNGLMGGYVDNGVFHTGGGHFWTSTISNVGVYNSAYYRRLTGVGYFPRLTEHTHNAYRVRCLKD